MILKINKGITQLDLEFMHLEDKNVKLIAEALKYNNTLKKLNIKAIDEEENKEGAESICEALKVNRTLKKLIMSYI